MKCSHVLLTDHSVFIYWLWIVTCQFDGGIPPTPPVVAERILPRGRAQPPRGCEPPTRRNPLTSIPRVDRSPSPRVGGRWSFACLLIGVMGMQAVRVPTSAADVFLLKSGGRIEGVLVNSEESPRTHFTVQLATGGEITIDSDQVERHLPITEAQRRYAATVEKMPATPEGNWIMANWCKERGLKEERQFHLSEVVRLDPEHEPARRAGL